VRLHSDQRVPTPAATLLEQLRTPDLGLGAIDGVHAEREGTELRVRFDAVRPICALLSVTQLDQGVRLTMVEGDVSDLTIELQVLTDGDGARVQLTGDLDWPLVLPASLRRELEGRWLAEAVRNWADRSGVPPGSGRSDG
jgi:hypothetical protein